MSDDDALEADLRRVAVVVDRPWRPGDDPGALRDCNWPGCPEQLNIIEHMGGGRPQPGWRRSWLVGYLCPAHSIGPHMPSQDVIEKRATPLCGCGWSGEPAPSIGLAAAQWRQHIVGLAS